jgi:hypothetical protein
LLKISEALYAAFIDAADDLFRGEAVKHVLARDGTLAEVEARRIVDYAILLGERIEIVSAPVLLKFLDLILRLGPGFEQRSEHARVVALLEEPGPGWQRVNRAQMLLDGIDPEARGAEFLRAGPPVHG